MTKSEAAAVLGSIGGAVRSDKKAESSRKNGKLGGRPRGAKNKVVRKVAQ